jgi:cephalosporin hydroxylase
LKKLLYNPIRSAFRRLFDMNSATIDLVEALYHEVERCKTRAPIMAVETSSSIRASNARAPDLASCHVISSEGIAQDQATINNIRPLNGFNAVYTAPAEMRMPERVALYSLIFGIQPKNCLEIGTFRGGSSAIICGALDDTGFGQLACVDMDPKIEPELWAKMSNRCRLFCGASPDVLSDVAREVGMPFDFVLIDGDHRYEFVTRDIDGVLPYLSDSAYLLFHDANHSNVKRALDDAVVSRSQLNDCGVISVEPTVLSENGTTVTWAGLRLFRFQRAARRSQAA